MAFGRSDLMNGIFWALVGTGFFWMGAARIQAMSRAASNMQSGTNTQTKSQTVWGTHVNTHGGVRDIRRSNPVSRGESLSAQIIPGTKRSSPSFVITTALSNSHLCALVQLLTSLNQSGVTEQVIVYDLNTIPDEFLQVEEIRRVYLAITVRRFHYNEYPSHFNVNKHAGHWAWKPVIIHEVVNEFGECLWLDTGAVMLPGRKMSTVKKAMRDGDGFYSAPSRGTPFQFVHVGTWLQLGIRKCCNTADVPISRQSSSGRACCCCMTYASEWSHPCLNCTSAITLVDANMTHWRNVNMCNGAIIAFSRQGRAYRDLLLPWVRCATQRECIAPNGPGLRSSRSNHRQDQAALTLLADMAGFDCITRSIEVGFALHKDEVVDYKQCELILGRSAPHHVRVW